MRMAYAMTLLIVVLSVAVNQYVLQKQKQMPEPNRVLDLTITEEFAEKEICSLHQMRLQTDVVPIEGGFPAVSRGFNHSRFFPYANTSYDEGCVTGLHRQAKIKYCAICRRSAAWWSVKSLFTFS